METKDRIRMIMEDQHMTQQVFADFLQQSPATLSSIFNGRTRPTLQVIDAIKTKIPDISIEWLLYGTGDMYISHPQGSEGSILGGQMVGQEQTLNFDSSPSNIVGSSQNVGSSVGFQQGVQTTRPEVIREEIKIVDKTPRKVTEIRVYYDDQTYETFVPAKK
jgi:transcriptional regulator with XRE-family HTH domain